MRRLILAAVLAILADSSAVQAQIVGGPIPIFSGRGVFVPGGSHYAPGMRGGPLVWGNGPRIRLVAFGGIPLLAPIPLVVGGPTIVLIPTPGIQVVVLDDGPREGFSRQFPGLPPAQSKDDGLPPGAKPGDHLVIRPQKALPLLPPPEPIRLPDKAVAEKPAADRPPAPLKPLRPLPLVPPAPFAPAKPFPFDPFAERKVVKVEKPDPDPVKEVARLVKMGKEAFEAAEYGLAAEQFQRAAAADPRAALPVFLKAQAAFAAGRYSNAVAAVRAGLDLDKTWPAGAFDPKELYGLSPEKFTEQVAALRAVIAANPGESVLEFLLGYELWFVGEKAESRRWFDLAEKRLPGIAEAFK